MKISNWQVARIFIDGELDRTSDGDYYGIQDFFAHVEEIEVGYIYFFGFTRNLLCEVESITKGGEPYNSHCYDIHLTLKCNLDETKVRALNWSNKNCVMEVEP